MTTPTPAQQHVHKLRRMRENCTGFAHLDEERAALDYALAALEAVEEYEFGVWQDDGLQASGHCADLDDARREAAHYAMMYGQDGPVEVRIYGKRLIPADAVEVSRG